LWWITSLWLSNTISLNTDIVQGAAVSVITRSAGWGIRAAAILRDTSGNLTVITQATVLPGVLTGPAHAHVCEAAGIAVVTRQLVGHSDVLAGTSGTEVGGTGIGVIAVLVLTRALAIGALIQ
jgi:hypothetical protein